jgi:hypothetical protein
MYSPCFLPRLYCNLVVNSAGQVLVEEEYCNMDSVNEAVFDFYHSEVVQSYASNDFRKVFISLTWSDEVRQEDFRKMIKGALSGFLRVANKLSTDQFHKPICSLNHTELQTIKILLPFNLRTDFYHDSKWLNLIPQRNFDSIFVDSQVKCSLL